MPTGSSSASTSPTRLSNNNNSNNLNGATSDRKYSLDSSNCGGGKLATSTMSYDPTPYIQRARVTRPAPPKPSANPMQFVQIKPCNLYQSAQDQLKKAEEVKKVKEVRKEEPEDWQCNLDNWKSSRRKRVEHIIDRVVEVKKLELEEHDRTRRKSKTFSEMMEERSSRRTKLASLAVYTEDESNDLSDLGIGTSSASGKSSLSEDYDNHSVMSDNVDSEKPASDMNNHDLNDDNGISNRDYISSPGYETSSSTAPASSPDPCEYTYEGAIQDYKTRVSRAQSNSYNNGFNRSSSVSSPYSKDSTPERNTATITNETTTNTTFTPRRPSGTKIENRLMNFEVKSSTTDHTTDLNVPKKDLPKVDILKRRELFEKENCNVSSSTATTSTSALSVAVTTTDVNTNQKRLSGDFTNTKSIRERLSNLEKKPSDENKKTNRLSGDITSLKDRLQNLEKQISVTEKIQKIDVPVVPLKERLSSLQSAATKEEIKKPVLLVDEHQLEVLKKESREKQHLLKRGMLEDDNLSSSQEILNLQDESNVDTDREDSGIHTTDVSCSVSQTDEQPDLVNEETHHHINAEDGLCQNIEQLKNTEILREKCEETISKTTTVVPDVIRNSSLDQHDQPKLEESQQQQQLLDDLNATTSPEPVLDQEASVEEALELALRAIDNENSNTNNQSSSAAQSSSSSSLSSQMEENENYKNFQIKTADNDVITSSIKSSKENLLSQNNFSSEPIYQNVDEAVQQNQDQNLVKNNNKTLQKSQQQESETVQLKKSNEIGVQHRQETTSVIAPKSPSKNSQQIVDDESHYQIPKSSEPYYEVPKYHQKPVTVVPVYENIEIFYPAATMSATTTSNGGMHQDSDYPLSIPSTLMEPPKEKPPPPPIDDDDDENDDKINGHDGNNSTYEPVRQITSSSPMKHKQQQHQQSQQQSPNKNNNVEESPSKSQNNVKRINSTKRIKKELRNKRSSFLGIEGNDNDDIFFELTVAPPPDMAQLLQEERRLEKQLYMKAGLYESSDTGDSRDSGVSENHSRQSSEPFTNSSEEHEDLLIKKEKEIIEVLEKEEKKQRNSSENNIDWNSSLPTTQQQHNDENNCNDAKIQCIEDQIREQEEVLRVERELLQLEQEELKRQRENLMLRENLARRELEHGAKMLMSACNHNRSLQDINDASTNHYANVPNQIYQVEADYRKSMSDLPDFSQKRIPPVPPAKPMRSHQLSIDARSNNSNNVGLVKIATSQQHPGRIQHSHSTDDFVPLRNYQPTSAIHHGNMTRHTLHALSAAPKPKYTDGWVQATKSKPAVASDKNSADTINGGRSWLSYQQQKRKSTPEAFNYNKHWLIQEAEQRRIEQQRSLRNGIGNGWSNSSNSINSAIQRNGNSDNKPLPDAVIQTLTQRVQSKGLGERKRLDPPTPSQPLTTALPNDSLLTTVVPQTSPIATLNTLNSHNSTLQEDQQDKILSVSGKKKCSHCGDELGRGAAMIIESLRLFYHINCFKCCVCHVQLGDGLNGTDVRVRNHKLHCHNCYSSDDGIKFSCV